MELKPTKKRQVNFKKLLGDLPTYLMMIKSPQFTYNKYFLANLNQGFYKTK